MGKITQKEFVAAVREVGDTAYLGGVSYQHPGRFQVGERTITIERGRISRFLLKLSAAMSFSHYDALTRSVWVASMKAEGNAVAEDRPQWAAVHQRRKKDNAPILSALSKERWHIHRG
jgi:hypothetical protein